MRSKTEWRWHWPAALALLLGLLLTAALTISSEASYHKNERRLTDLQTRLTGMLLQTAQPQLEGTLGRVVGLSAAAADPVSTFREQMMPLLAPKGSYASASLAVVNHGQVQVLDHEGSPSIRGLTSPDTNQLFQRAAQTKSLLTTRAVGNGVQKLGYLLSAPGPRGVFVVGLAQQIPANRRVTVPSHSPDSNLYFALYFGRSTNQAALIETNAGHLPLEGTVASTTVPWGDNVLTFVASPRGSLAGTWSQNLPWGILGVGIVMSVLVALMTDRLVRRRRKAESLALEIQELYDQQRAASLSLQRALLPRELPSIPGFELAARYAPGTQGAEIGGDWYSVVGVDEQRFAVVMGDVSGHGMAAAGAMASLRYTIRTLAALGFPPDEMLVRAGREVSFGGEDDFATAVVGVVDTKLQQLAVASAGHPPPLLVHDGRAEFVEVSPGVPLGVSGRRPQVSTVGFRPGSTLVVFTDGLIERRGQALDEGLARLRAVAAEHLHSEPEQLITELLSALTGGDQEDDIGVLAVRCSGQKAASVPASPRHGHAIRAGDPG